MGLKQEIKTSYSYLKLHELINRYTYTKKFRPMAGSMERFNSCTTKKSKSRIRREIEIMRKHWNCFPFQYYRYDLYRDDMELTDGELISYVPEYFFYRLYLPYYSNNTHNIIIDDKIILNQYFQSLKISQPQALLKIIKGKYYDAGFNQITPHDLKDILGVSDAENLFLKPVGGRGGYGIKVFMKNGPAYINDEQNILDDDYLRTLNTDESFILQAGLKQHKEISDIYGESINTFRMATENMQGEPRILFCMMRIGKGGSKVDNFSQGNLIASVNLETGKLKGPAFSPDYDKYEKHPDTGYSFSSFENTQWEKIKQFVLQSARKIPQFNYLGWDIALTENGPVAIEVNRGFDLDMVQIAEGGAKKLFKIDDPMAYWKLKRKAR